MVISLYEGTSKWLPKINLRFDPIFSTDHIVHFPIYFRKINAVSGKHLGLLFYVKYFDLEYGFNFNHSTKFKLLNYELCWGNFDMIPMNKFCFKNNKLVQVCYFLKNKNLQKYCYLVDLFSDSYHILLRVERGSCIYIFNFCLASQD